MKNSIKVLVMAFLGGLAGAFVFQQLMGQPQVTEIVRETPTIQANHRMYDSPIENDILDTELTNVDFRSAAERSVHSVVYIINKQRNRRSISFLDFFSSRRDYSSQEVPIGSGSGVIYSEDGYIITNYHVIKGADAIEVQHEKRSYTAELVGTDPDMDIAVLKIDGSHLPAIEIARSAEAKVGDWVLAVGNPFNLTSTVTAGIISAIGSEANVVRDNFPIELYIQTDAAINPGNSGGALVNTQGELLGINTSIISRTGSYAGYGFAVPSDVVVKIVEDLKKYKVVQIAYTGAELADINSELAQNEQLPSLNGVFVKSVKRKGASELAGIEAGDVIRMINNTEVNSKSKFDEVVSSLSPGDLVPLAYERNGKLYETTLTLENALGNTEILGSDALREEDIYFSNFLGAELRVLTNSELEDYRLKTGVKVTSIDAEKGFMRRLDINEGDIIIAINRRGAAEPRAVSAYLEKYYGRIYIDIIDSRGREKTLTYTFQ
jgi:S1-C subfamily serine protease